MHLVNRLLLCTVILVISVAVRAQYTASSANAIVPRLVNFSGAAISDQGKPVTGLVGITFSIYSAQQGSSPLWMETQNVQTDARGNYTVQLGATTSQGLPLSLFSSGEARWLGVRVSGGEEQPRILLLSVPYALKAADAQTLGGLPASAFALAAPAGSSSGVTNDSASSSSSPTSPNVGGSGTQDYIPLWTDNSGDLGNSILYQLGTGTSAKVGINLKDPLFTLDVNGQELVRGLFEMATMNYATKTKGFDSNPLNFESSAFNSGTGAYTLNHFQWQAEPTGNNTTTPGATLNMLYGTDPNQPAETGLNIASSGQITFAKGQTFPGAGTITGVTTATGSGLSGGGTNGTLNLSLTNSCATNQVLQWNGSAWACSSGGTGTITGVTAGTDLTGGGTGGNVTLNLDTTQVPQLHAANTFTGTQTVNGSLSVTSANTAIVGSTANQGYNGIFGIASATSGGSLGVYGTTQDASGAGVEGVNEAGGTGVIGISSGSGLSGNAGVAGYGSNAPVESNSSGNLGVYAQGGNAGTLGEPIGGDGIDAYGGTGTVYLAGAGIGAFGGYDAGPGGFFTGAAEGYGIYATGGGAAGAAGVFHGNVNVEGNLTKSSGSFKIDHPLDPANKYLYHSFVESPDMKNIYDGVATLDANGEATIQMPDWFGVLNRDFRYQLTCIGGFAPVYIAEKLANNQFKIGGGRAGLEVSWQITGIRQDAWANAHRIPVEEDKEAKLKGFYIHPELYGAPPEKQIEWARQPRIMKKIQEHQQQMKAPAIQSTNLPHGNTK